MTSARRQSSSLGGDKGEIDNTRLDRKHRKGRTMSGQSRRNLGPSPVGATLDKNRRGLCEGVNNHCFNPEEKNVFSPPSAQITIAPTMAPSISPQPTSFRTDPTGCESDEQGNYGVIDGPSFRTVSYRYQVETTPELSSAVMLNVEVLQDVEKAISDLMVQRFFAEECSPPTISIESPNNTNQQQQQLVIAKVQGDISMGRESDRGGIRKLLARNMKSEVHEELVGLSAEPPDQVLEGDEGDACPFPTTTGPCFVVGGGLTMFGDGADGTNGGLLWVDEGIHEELLDAMNSGKLEEKVQLEHPEITAIRYIPPGTELPTSTDPDGIDEGFIGARSSALSWLLIGLGFFVLLSVFVYLFISRRRGLQEEEERNTSAQVGAFPIVVSPQNVARAQGSHHESSGKATNTYSEISRHYSTSADLLISNNQSDSDDSDHDIEGTRLHVFHDDDNSPRQLPQGISTGWRDQILRNSNNRAPESPFGSLDPNQPFVRPILHDEQDGHGMTTPSRELQSPAEFSHYHSAHSGRGDHGFSSSREYYSSAEFSGYHSVNSREYGTNSEGGSSLSSSPRHLSPSRQDSPSKLTVAFDRGEML